MFKKLFKKIANELNTHNIPYMIIGGQAILLYGEPRLTKDIDITLGIGIDGVREVNSIIQKLNLKILINIHDKEHYPLNHLDLL